MTPEELHKKGLRLKPLIWQDYIDGVSFIALTIVGQYYASPNEPCWAFWNGGSLGRKYFKGEILSGAKAACEAHHEALIASCIEEAE